MVNLHKSESGRSMLEMIAIIILMAILLLAGLWGFKAAMLSSKVNTLSKDLSNAVTERRYLNTQGGNTKDHKLDTKVGNTEMHIENRISQGDFFITIKNMTSDVCKEMKKFNVFKPKALSGKKTDDSSIPYTIDIEGFDCSQISALDFYFDNYGDSSGVLHGTCDGCGPCEKCSPSGCESDVTKNGMSCDTNHPCKQCLNGSCVAHPGTECGTKCCPGECNADHMDCAGTGPSECEANADCDNPCQVCNSTSHTCEFEYVDRTVPCGTSCCQTGQVCDGGVCTGCTADSQCTGQCGDDCEGECVCEDGKCTCTDPSTSCEADADCGDPCKKCDTITHTCVLKDSNKTVSCGTTCCQNGQVCDGGVCTGCTADSQCVGQCGDDCEGECVCEDGKCTCTQCTADSQCVGQCGDDCEGECVCEDGKCTCTQCTEDSQCVGQCSDDCEGICTCGENGKCICDTSCTSNADCAEGKYCSFKNNITAACQKPEKGICTPLDDVTVGDGTYTSSKTSMDYWSAENFCAAVGKSTVSYWSHCTAEERTAVTLTNGTCKDWKMKPSDKDVYWTNTESSSCASYTTAFGPLTQSATQNHNQFSKPLCQSCPDTLPGRDEPCTQGCGCQAPWSCETDLGICSCAEKSGIIFFIDRSSGYVDYNTKALKSLSELPKLNTAIYFQDYSGTNIKEANEQLVNPLKYGPHTSTQLEEWFNYGNVGGGSSFKHALNDIKKYCRNQSQVLLLLFAGDAAQHYRGNVNKELNFWKDFAQYAENNCQFNIWVVGANTKIADLFGSTKFKLSKSVGAYEYIFKDAVEAVCKPRNVDAGGINTDLCSIPANFAKTTKSQCDLCPNDTRFWPEPANYVESRDSAKTNICYMCTHQGTIYTSQEECKRCSQRTYNPTTRTCLIEGCYSSNGVKMSSDQCQSCRITMTEAGEEQVASESDDPTVRFLGKNGNCYPCNIASNIQATEEECNKCNGSRSMSGGYCVKEACDKTKNYTNMTEENCHQVCTTEGQVAPFSHFWLNDGKKTSNSCVSCSNATAYKTTSVECNRCTGSRFYSKKTGTCYLCTAGDVELSDISEGSEEVELCLACGNRTVDEETKKCVRMDCSNKTTYSNVLPEVCHACGESGDEGAFRFFVKTNNKTGRGSCYSCSNTSVIASNVKIFDAKSFTEEVIKYCKGKRFVGMDNKSYSCDTNTQVQVSTPVLGSLFDSELDQLCRACGNRSVDETTGKCVKMNCDASSKEVYTNVSEESCHACPGRFWYETNTTKHLGSCYPCTSDYKGVPNSTLSECQRCGTERYFSTPNNKGIGKCYSCSSTTQAAVGDDKTRQEMCLACKGGNYRTISSTNTCNLFDCSTSSKYNNYTEEQCHTVCGQTETSKTYFWQFAGAGAKTSTCWPCQYKQEQAVRVNDPEECYRCNTGTQPTNTNHFFSTNGYCYQCFSTASPKVSGEEHCSDQCPNRFMNTAGQCVIFTCSDITITPKMSVEQCHTCTGNEARFLNTSKQCISCNTATDTVAASLSETQICSGKRFQAGTNSYACSHKGRVKITTDEEETLCTACPGRVIFQESTGAKYCSALDCSTSATFSKTTQEDCHACEGGTAFWKTGNTCYSCLYTSNVSGIDQNECKRCENRYFVNNTCKICPNKTTEKATDDGLSCVPYEDQFFSASTGNAYLCSHTSAIATTKAECQKCANRHLNDKGQCQLCPNGGTSADGLSCSSIKEDQFMGTNNKVYECSVTSNVTASFEQSKRCDNRYWYNNTSKICPKTSTGKAMDNGYACTVAEGSFFGVKDNKAYACSVTTNVTTTEEQCKLCPTRHMDNGLCKLCPNGTTSADGKTCDDIPDGQFMGSDNKYHDCTITSNVNSSIEQSQRCDNRYWYNKVSKICPKTSSGKAMDNGYACTTASGSFFGVKDNKAYACSITTNVTTTEEQCKLCPTRYMESGVCKLCPNGTTSTDGKVCDDIPAGQFIGTDKKYHGCTQTTAVTATQEQCNRCPGRFYASNSCQLTPKGYYSKNGVKTECGIGYQCPNTGMTSPIECTAGTYSDKSTASACTDCPEGYYCPGKMEKQACGAGYYCAGKKRSNRQECEAGTYSDTTTAKACKTCTVGHYCPDRKMTYPLDCGVGYMCAGTGLKARTKCGPGTYSSTTTAQKCTDCQKGYYCPGKGDRKPCGAGHYCPNAKSATFEKCPEGSYVSSTTATACTQCAAGYYCPNKEMTAETPCGEGYICPGKGRTNREICKAKTFTSSKTATACTKCTKGHYCPEQGMSSAKECGKGYYCPNTEMNAPLECDVGTYSNITTATSCTKCGTGTYQDEKGKDSCKTCSGNSVTTKTGLSKCTKCTGTKPCSNAGHTACVSATTKGAICS